MAFLTLKPECVKSSFYYMKIGVEKVIFICCCLRHPELHKYPARCVCQVCVPTQKCSSQTGKNFWKMGLGSGLCFWESALLCGGAWGPSVGSGQSTGVPKGGWDGGEAVLKGVGIVLLLEPVFPDRPGAARVWCRHFPTYPKELQAQTLQTPAPPLI